MPKEIPVVFHNGSKLCLSFYNKRTSKRDWREILFVYENMVKNTQFFSQWQKDLLRIDRNRKEISKTISYKLQFIDSARFKASLLPNLVDNLAEGIHKVKWKNEHNSKKMWNVWN